jgi:multimeric flavodoxin WrbA
MDSDAVLLGSPIYFNDVTGMLRSFMERLAFMNLTYDDPYRTAPGKSINSAFFFSMNLSETHKEYYIPLFENSVSALRLLGGITEYYACYDTFQFDDYEKYAAGFFDAGHKKKIRTDQWPLDCNAAYEIGKRLASISR